MFVNSNYCQPQFVKTEKEEDKKNRFYKRSLLVTVTLNTEAITYFWWFHFYSIYHIFCMSSFDSWFYLCNKFIFESVLYIFSDVLYIFESFNWWTCVKTVSLNSLKYDLYWYYWHVLPIHEGLYTWGNDFISKLYMINMPLFSSTTLIRQMYLCFGLPYSCVCMALLNEAHRSTSYKLWAMSCEFIS